MAKKAKKVVKKKKKPAFKKEVVFEPDAYLEGISKRDRPEIKTNRVYTSIIDQFAPPIRLLVKLGSIIVHADEASSTNGHEFDWVAFRSLLADREVESWLAVMTRDGYLPVKRNRDG